MKHEDRQVKAGSVKLAEHALDNAIARVDVPQNENSRSDLDRTTVQLRDDDSCEEVNNTEDNLMTANLIGNSVVKDCKSYKNFTKSAPNYVVEFINKTRPEDRPSGQDQRHLSEPSTDQVNISRESPTGVESAKIVVGSEEIAESNETPFDEGESDFSCDTSSSQDEKKESKMPSQADESGVICGWGETLPTTTSVTTMGACNDSPTNTKSSVSMTNEPAEPESDRVGYEGDSVTSLDASVTSSESTVSSQANECASEAVLCDATCTNTSLDSVSDGCNINISGECHDKSSDISQDKSLSEQETAAAIDLTIANDSFADTVSDVVPNEKSTCSGADSSGFVSNEKTTELITFSKVGCPSSTPSEAAKTDVSDIVPLPGKYEAPSFLHMLIALCLIRPVSSLNGATNLAISISNVTEIVSVMLGNGSESYSAPDRSEMLAVYWTIAISFAIGIVHLVVCCQPIFNWYTFILRLGVRTCTSACSYVWHVLCLLFKRIKYRSSQQVELVLPLTSAPTKDVQNSATNLAKHFIPPSKETMPPRAIEHSSNSKHLQQSIESGYHSMPPTPLSSVALPSGKDGHVCVNRKPVFNTHSVSIKIQSEVSSLTTEPGSIDVLEPVFSPPPTNNKQRADHSSTKVECTKAENCDPGEFVTVGGFRRSFPRTAISRREVQQEDTQPGEGRSEFAGLTQHRQERTIQVVPPVVIANLIVPTQANVEPSPVHTVALPIDPAVQVLAFNAAVDEAEHDAPDPPEDVPNHTPITLENSYFSPEQGIRLNIGLADAEVHIFQLKALPFTRPHAAVDDTADSTHVYPPLPGIPFANAELQPVFPPLPAAPSTSTPMVITPVTYFPRM